MRKAQKQEILEIIENFPEMHREIRTAVERGSLAVAMQLLQDCQEYAVSLCQMLLETEEKASVVTGAFEEYCLALVAVVEKLEQVEESDADGNDTESEIMVGSENCSHSDDIWIDAAEGEKVINDLLEQLNIQSKAIAERIEKEIPIHKEVVFFPYKASMWDSLESIYLAAKEDENCDAYCVPIPYFDKNPDGSFKEMHYEGKEYPANIEVTDWQSYHFEERRPDVIYIHNPYDNSNYVTSVHPRFYAENLKKYTEELVYIPYFVLQEIEPDDQAKIDDMKHFCFVPGTVYADKVILQSEKMAQIYRNEYKKAVESAGGTVDEEQLKEKFLGLGSPKFDKVLNTRKEDLEIPPEWLQIIEKPDGSRKKIIFYNTSVTALLQNDERMLEKMKHVFGVFKEHQEEVALLWRPHPLIQSTIESMRPQLWKAYHKLVEQYQEEGWGIYDDTPDMDRAVVLSDAYYGDPSSIVQLYQKTGKPVLIQCVDILD